MSNVPDPGLNNQATVRTGLRTVGLVLGLGGFAVAIFGFGSLAYTMFSGDPFADGGHMGLYFVCFGAGAFLGVIGMGMANAGFMGATNRYIAGETVPVITTDDPAKIEWRVLFQRFRTFNSHERKEDKGNHRCP